MSYIINPYRFGGDIFNLGSGTLKWLIDARESDSYTISTGSNVASINDLSGNNYDIDAVGTEATVSGGEFVFTGSEEYRDTTSDKTSFKFLHDGTDWTIVYKITPTISGGSYIILETANSTADSGVGLSINDSSGTDRLSLSVYKSSAGNPIFNTNNTGTSFNNFFTSASQKIYSHVVDFTGAVVSDPVMKSWIDGVDFGTDENLENTGWDTGDHTDTFSFAKTFDGNLVGMAIYEGNLTNSDREVVENYFN